MTSEAIAQKTFDVSRETIHRLKLFEALLRRWNPRINLVSSASLDNLWSRHIVDSMQVFRHGLPVDHWVDLGSGGGFPGLIAAVMAVDESPETKFTLIESDQRKAAFLRAAAREVGVSCDVLVQRVKAVAPLNADIISARALADLKDLLHLAARHISRDGFALFPKGATWKKEVAIAQEKWCFRFEPITSVTDPQAVILKIEGASLV